MAVDTLGCGTYEVYFKYRGGSTFLDRARDLTALSWSRKLNDVSVASVTISLNGTDTENCCGLAGSVNPWEHELSIYRDGTEVWVGPVTGGSIDLSNATVQFDAKDLFAWFDHRWVEIPDNPVEFDEVDITVVFDWLLAHGYYKDPFNLEWFVGEPLNIPITRDYEAFYPPGDRWGGVYHNIGEQIRGLLRSRIDYTTIRRVLIAGDLQNGSNITPARIVDKDWSTLPKIVIVGTGMATEQAVAGGNGGYFGYNDDEMWIERPLDEARFKYGLLQKLDPSPELDEEDTTGQPNLITQRAAELRAIRSVPFVYLNGGSLSSNAEITFDQLIPGRHFRCDLVQSCRAVQSNYLLTDVNVSFSSNGEDVALILVPPGLNQLSTA